MNYWSPYKINYEKQKHHYELLEKKVNLFKKNKKIYLRNYKLAYFSYILFMPLYIYTFSKDILPIEIFFGGAVGIILIPFGYKFSKRPNLKEILKYHFCKKNNYLYNPWTNFSVNFITGSLRIKKKKFLNNSSQEEMFKKFSKLLDKKNRKDLKLDDEIWGKKNLQDFYMADFSYKIPKGRDNKYINNYLFIIKTKKKLKNYFLLKGENIFDKFKNKINNEDITTSSIEFNKRFKVEYENKNNKNLLEIFKTLSPIILNKLLDLRNKYGGITILFQDNTICFLFDNSLLSEINLKTDLYETDKINEGDLKNMDSKINEIIEVGINFSKYL